jgi:hypothetical protein
LVLYPALILVLRYSDRRTKRCRQMVNLTQAIAAWRRQGFKR